MKKYNLIIKGICNTNCSFCNFYEQKDTVNPKKHLEELKKEVKEAVLSGHGYIQIGYYGYEPTTFPFFIDILMYIKEQGLKLSLSTNGVLFADKDFTNKVSKFIDLVYITLYSSSNEEHFLYTQKKQSYLIKHIAISRLLASGVTVHLQVLLLKGTLFTFNRLLQQIEKYEKHSLFEKNVTICVASPEMDTIRIQALVPSYMEIVEALNNSEQIQRKSNINYSFSADIPKCISKFLNNTTYIYHESSLSAKYHYIKKCNNCEYKKDRSCKGINLLYLNTFGDEEIGKKKLGATFKKISNNDIYYGLQKAKKLYKT